MPARKTVLIVDDDPTHLRIYGWIVESVGYHPFPIQVRYGGITLPEENADAVLLDYHLPGELTAADIAGLIRSRFPDIPIIVLSDRWDLPDDVTPFVQGFVRKGDPAKLVEALGKVLSPP